MNAQGSNLLFIIAMMAIFYLLILRPQQKRAKAQRDMLSALAAGDEIMTAGGIYATVVSAGERVRIRVADGSELEIAPQAVGQVIASSSASAAAGGDEGLEDGIADSGEDEGSGEDEAR